MNDFSSSLVSAIRSHKQTHFDSVLEDMRQWHHKNGAQVEWEFAQNIVDIFDYTIKSSHRDLLTSGVALLAQWIVNCASDEAAHKLFDVVNNPWLVRELLGCVDDPRMLHKCNLEDLLYNQSGVLHRKINTSELMLFVKLPAPKCIQYIFSDPFVLKALNQEDQSDKTQRLSENDHIFWSLTDPAVTHALPDVLTSLLSHNQHRWVGYYMKAICSRSCLEAFQTLTQHPKFSSEHLRGIEQFFATPVKFQTPVLDFISQIKPRALSLQAKSSHIATLIFKSSTSHRHLAFHSDALRQETQWVVESVNNNERVTLLCQSLEKCYTQQREHYNNGTQAHELLFDSFSFLSEMMTNSDLDGCLDNLNAEILDVVRVHPAMQQQILRKEVGELSDSSALTKRKM